MSLTLEGLQHLFGIRYRLIRELGGGSMAAVFLAEDGRHGRQVALKVLRPEYAATFASARFLREIEIAARLQHPHIVPLLDSGEAGGHLYLVMPYVEGESLRVRLVRDGRLPVGEVVRILADVADALAYAHGKGIIHRDIKPDNILLAGRHALVTDFGVAKAVSAASPNAPRDLTVGVALGTPTYMAPEQATADPGLDHRVDLYALGVVGYELLMGQPPFEGPTAQAILTAHVLDAPPPLDRPEVSPALAAIIMRALAKAPAERWQSAEELLRQLEPLATPSGGTTPAAVAPVARPVRALRWLALAGVAAVAAGVAVLWPRPAPANPMEGLQRQVTFSGSVRSVALSPDGQQLAFISDSAGMQRLMVQDLRGGQSIQLLSGRQLDHPSWSSDGSEVRCGSYDGTTPRLHRIPRLGGPSRDLVVPYWSTLAPDGTRLAALPQGSNHLTIRSMTMAESLVVRLDPAWWYSAPTWSPDGQQVAWSGYLQAGRHTRLYLTRAQGQLQPAVVLEDTMVLGTPGWAPEGNALYYLRGDDRVADLMRLPLERGSPSGPAELIRAGLTVGAPEGEAQFQDPPTVSTDGSRLALAQRQEWSNLGVVGFEEWHRGVAPRPLTTGSAAYTAARFSPDGRSVLLIRTESDGWSLQTLRRDGGAPMELGRGKFVASVAWSPSGRRVAVVVIDPDSGHGLRLFPLDGTAPRSLLYGQVGDAPEWVDDSTLVIPRLGNRSLQLVNTRTGTAIKVPGLDSTRGWMLWPRATADGSKLAFSWNRGNGDRGLYSFDLRDRSLLSLAPGAIMHALRWSDDGASLFTADGSWGADSEHVFRVRGDGTGFTRLASFPADIEAADVSGDGRLALLILHQHRSDAWVIEFPRRPR